MSGEFLAALDPTSFKATLSRDKQSYICACGLSVGIGVDEIAADSSALSRPDLLKAAHQFHHRLHFGVPATLYMISSDAPSGLEILTAAQCSCEYDKEHPRA